MGCLDDLTHLSEFPDLEELHISNLPLINDLSFLEMGLAKLRVLHINNL